MSGNKTHKVKIRDKIVDLKETKHRSNRVIDQKQAVGTYEFTMTPRALVSPNGSVLPCNDKSKFINVLHTLTTRETTEADQQSAEHPIETDADPPDHRRKIAKVDGMVLIQKMTTKPATVVTVKDISVCFNDRLMNLTRSYAEVILSLTHTRLILSRAQPGKRGEKERIQSSTKSDIRPASGTSQ